MDLPDGPAIALQEQNPNGNLTNLTNEKETEMTSLRTVLQEAVTGERSEAWSRLAAQEGVVGRALERFAEAEVSGLGPLKSDEARQRREVVLEVLGDKFARGHERDRKLLFVPFLAPQVRKEMESETRKRLKAFLEVELKGVRDPELTSELEQACLRLGKERGERAEALGGVLGDLFAGRGFELPLCMDDSEETEPPDFESFLLRCQGRWLPRSLRKFLLWRALSSHVHVEDCERDLLTGLEDRALPVSDNDGARLDPSHSKIHNLITRLIEENSHDHVLGRGMGLEAKRGVLKRAERLLNQFYVMRGEYNASVVRVLLPVLADFREDATVDDTKMLALFDALRKQLPSRREAPAVAKAVWATVVRRSPDLVDDVRNLIERSRANAVVASNQGCEPHELVVEWVQVAFVGILQPKAVQFAWTQCLLGGTWDVDKFARIAAEVLMLLSPWIRVAQTLAET
ncbi:Uncharacterized protein SCF082_LOCUS14343 [Durusdinium trenchii]|uniref:HEAT repeat-containing protein 1 n=1 Tax=Durusdinium trenchii TaxID=1381693 RepID=A0ABP0JX27_9DINO